jgi:hypothetical protein
MFWVGEAFSEGVGVGVGVGMKISLLTPDPYFQAKTDTKDSWCKERLVNLSFGVGCKDRNVQNWYWDSHGG